MVNFFQPLIRFLIYIIKIPQKRPFLKNLLSGRYGQGSLAGVLLLGNRDVMLESGQVEAVGLGYESFFDLGVRLRTGQVSVGV